MLNNTKDLPVILTGDRTTGRLHLGHYVGSLKNRVLLQDSYRQYLLLADVQALTDNMNTPDKVRDNVIEVALDYLAVGIDPTKTTICVQSYLPALYELTMLYLNFVTVARLERNPTIKEEIILRGFERDIPAGFLCYPVAQAADITAFKATLVPVGDDQLPMIELTNEISRKVNRQIGRELLPEVKTLLSSVSRLPGINGKGKMSKSQGNAISLSATKEEVRKAIHQMYTDPNHLRVSDPGKVEGNVVFTYLDAFDDEPETVKELKAHYQRGGLGDTVLKKRLEYSLEKFLEPIRERREAFARDPSYVLDVLKEGTLAADQVTRGTLEELKNAIGLFKF